MHGWFTQTNRILVLYSQTEQMYTYFVRRHLNRVAEKCQEESRKIQAEAADARSSQQQLKDINLIYRQLVRLMRIHRAAI